MIWSVMEGMLGSWWAERFRSAFELDRASPSTHLFVRSLQQ